MPPQREVASYGTRFRRQMAVLLKKNYLVTSTHSTASLVQIFAGVGLVVLVGLLATFIQADDAARLAYVDRPNVSGSEEAMKSLGTCVPLAGSTAIQEGGQCQDVGGGVQDEDSHCFCYSFAYVHHGSVAAKSIVLDIARRAGIPTAGDCAPLAEECDGDAGRCPDARAEAYMRCGDGLNQGIIGFRDKPALDEWMIRSWNKTRLVFHFVSPLAWDGARAAMRRNETTELEYTIQANRTHMCDKLGMLGCRYAAAEVEVPAQHAIDGAILRRFGGELAASHTISSSFKPYPHPERRVDDPLYEILPHTQ